MDTFVILSGLLVFSFRRTNVVPGTGALAYVIYVALFFGFTIFVGGFDVAYPPRFVFGYSEEFGEGGQYSLGVSRFFGFAAIAGVVAFYYEKRLPLKVCLFGFCLLALLLSFIGGARGDSMLALMLVVCVLGVAYFKTTVVAVFVAVVLGFYFLDLSSLSDDFLILRRLAVLNDNLGYRDILFAQALNLLAWDNKCLVFGCGFGYFQDYYGYSARLYPHNVLVEFAVIYGLPMLLLFFFLAGLGIVAYIRRSGVVDLFLLFFVYAFVVHLKSGAWYSEWFFVVGFVYFVATAIDEIFTNKWFRR